MTKNTTNQTQPATHGGKRDGAGRKPKYKGATCRITVPISMKQEILDMIEARCRVKT